MDKVRPAAGIVPVRRQESGWSVLLVQRGRQGRFFPGYHAFPGGGLEPTDADLSQTAARELFEETGLWVGHRQPPADLRRAWLERKISWAGLLAEHPLRPGDLMPAGLRTTPEYALIRFSAQFYLWECPAHQQAEIWPGELEQGDWWTPEQALSAWQAGEICLAPPTQDSLQGLCRALNLEQASQNLCALPEHTPDPIRVRPDLTYLPLLTPTLPPARHTLCFILGQQSVIVVDPGSSDPDQQARLDAVLQGRQVEAVLFTHHHPDHVGGRNWAEERNYPIWCHAQTARLAQLSPARILHDQERIGPWEVLHTPGHASGHLALWHPATATLLSGDLVSGVSTILVSPPDGNMADYMQSLERTRALQPRLVLPSHGGPFGPGSDLLGQTLRHRQQREERVIQALGGSIKEILARAYADVSGPALKWAEISLLAHLQKLEGEGRAQRRDERWCPA